MVSSGNVSCIVVVYNMHVEYRLVHVCVLVHVHVLVGVKIMCILAWIHVHIAVSVALPIVVGAWPMVGTLWWVLDYYYYKMHVTLFTEQLYNI